MGKKFGFSFSWKRALGYIQAEVAMGIPVNISGKSIYYDRPTPAKH